VHVALTFTFRTQDKAFLSQLKNEGRNKHRKVITSTSTRNHLGGSGREDGNMGKTRYSMVSMVGRKKTNMFQGILRFGLSKVIGKTEKKSVIPIDAIAANPTSAIAKKVAVISTKFTSGR
jgi:hypothetical protein